MYLKSAPVRFLMLVAGTWLAVFFVTRCMLLAASASVSMVDFVPIFCVGLIYDLTYLVYALLPLGVYVLICPARVWGSRLHRIILQVLFSVSVYVMLFTAVAEWLFWDEFGVRFNFIAVDYLVYSKEVVNNILESYPIGFLLSALGAATVILSILMRPLFARAVRSVMPGLGGRLKIALALSVMALACALLIDQTFPRYKEGSTYVRELQSNGPYQFFAAFRNNELDYAQFYKTLSGSEAGAIARSELLVSGSEFSNADLMDVRRRVSASGVTIKPNIVLVTIESFSAKYMGSNGDGRNLTPNLDKLRKDSLYFSNFYATGTRTDRGLEAITLSIPPTPGRSIVKRIGRESGFASLGQQLNHVGYDSVFLYGGRGYFDNMNAFFSGNGYRVVDQSSMAASEMQFTNAWGMSDEDLYAQALKLADEDHKQGVPFFLQLMTTSNHRPYTYPEGRIDIPSGEGREGAVKYTDYAIGKFLEGAKDKAWFDNTIFIFVADHTAGSAGKEDLPVINYQIPLFIYSPKLIAAGEDAQLASQIDLAPTLLGVLNLNYTSTFFGRDLLKPNNLFPRVLIGNYQHLGLYDGKDLAILSPQGGLRIHENALGDSTERLVDADHPLVKRAIAYYQTASHAFTKHLLNWEIVNP